MSAVKASFRRSHLIVAIHASQAASSLGVRAREKLCTMPRSKKNCWVDFDVICVQRSDAAAGSLGACQVTFSRVRTTEVRPGCDRDPQGQGLGEGPELASAFMLEAF
jgi:hypothetical protein